MKKLTLTLTGNTAEAIANCLEQVALEMKLAYKNEEEITGGYISFAGADGTSLFVDEDQERAWHSKQAGYYLTENQVKFCIDADTQGFDIIYSYSGRGMFGKQCPSVNLEDMDDFLTDAETRMDSMGTGYVKYAQK